MVLKCGGLIKAQIYKMPYRDSPHHETENVMSFNHLHLFEPIEHKEEYHIRKPNNENFVLEFGDEKCIYVGEKLITFETNDTILKYSSKLGFIDSKFPYAYGGENIYLMLHRKYISI